MNKKMSKRQKDIKSKLMAAICMLLVSSIMMVSSTYAWFTLSTAPEVTGITTAVGANGNLEMALLPTDGQTSSIKSEVGDSIDNTNNFKLTNVTWGNLVDLSDGYGLNEITLFPARLNAATKDADGNPLTLAEALLANPVYGADGRVSELKADTVTSTYVEDSFPTNTEYGVRAVGTASGMTDRQLAYRNARSAASTAMAQAKNAASTSLTDNGNALASIAIAHGADKSATHTQADVNALLAIVNDLLGTDSTTGVLEYIDNAYLQYILAYGASQAAVDAGMDDSEFILFKGVLDAATSVESAIAELEKYGVTLPIDTTSADSPIAKLAATKATVLDAQGKLNALVGTGDNIEWSSISPALYLLADTDAMEVNGIPVSGIMDKISELATSIGSGVTVSMGTGGGVYADVADHCGDYSASIVIKEIKYGDTISLENFPARMATESTVNPSYLTLMGTKVQEALSPASADDTSMPITDMYGYVIDLAFRTNAAESTLLLQQDGVDRIYDENGNEETMGGGSTMTFKSTTTDFTDAKLKELMGAIRIVFFQKDGGNVVATAKLDTANATSGAEGVTAKMYLYEVTAGGEEVYVETEYDATKTDVTYYTKGTKDVYTEVTGVTADNYDTYSNLYTTTDNVTYTPATGFAEGTTYYAGTTEDVYTEDTTPTAEETLYTKTTTTAGENKLTDNEIIALTQNQAVQLSVLVYLDGDNIGNDDVAATAATSATGKMNLQFASSATLVPMEYADLHLPATATEATEATNATEPTT